MQQSQGQQNLPAPHASGAAAATTMPAIPPQQGGNVSLLTSTVTPPRPQLMGPAVGASPTRTLDFSRAGGPHSTPLSTPQQAQPLGAGAGVSGFSHPMPAAQAAMLLASPSRRSGSARSRPGSSAGPKKHCNCKNSRCLKLYCECFASGRYCEGCNCANCCNNRGHEATRQAAVEAILDRNPNAFRPKIQASDETATRHNKGCNCKKSGCLKKYCECFQAGVFCSDNCKCIDCKNFEGSDVRELVVRNQADEAHRSGGAASPQPKRPRMLGPAPAAAAVAPPGGLPRPAAAGPPPMPSPAAPSGVHIQAAMREVMQRGIVEEMAQLLVLVAREEGDCYRRGGGGAEQLAEAASAVAAAPQQQPSSDQAAAAASASAPAADGGSAAAPGPQQLAGLHASQERAVLMEFNGVLVKVLDRVRKRASDLSAASAAAAAAAAASRAHPPPSPAQRPAHTPPGPTTLRPASLPEQHPVRPPGGTLPGGGGGGGPGMVPMPLAASAPLQPRPQQQHHQQPAAMLQAPQMPVAQQATAAVSTPLGPSAASGPLSSR